MNTASKLGPHTHKRTEGRAPVWGSEFTSKDTTLQGWGVSRSGTTDWAWKNWRGVSVRLARRELRGGNYAARFALRDVGQRSHEELRDLQTRTKGNEVTREVGQEQKMRARTKKAAHSPRGSKSR
jgi:hypothetical protein